MRRRDVLKAVPLLPAALVTTPRLPDSIALSPFEKPSDDPEYRHFVYGLKVRRDLVEDEAGELVRLRARMRWDWVLEESGIQWQDWKR